MTTKSLAALSAFLGMAILSGAALACTIPANLGALRGELLVHTNAERGAQGLPALAMETRLGDAAQIQACRMADRERLSHRGSWWAGLGRRLRREDYAYAMAVENTGVGYRDARGIIRGWMESPEHRVNMLSRDARDTGYGVAIGEDGRMYWSMVAAAPRPAG
ncbi:CAP domain-containing protein [Rhodobacter sp. NTK016B]|uniref:CAP domain-containing protein n=1 Tax=Rhodobacter sp. NTK016B TaxID=2759676 RepID=UPI001A8CB430|nr:CAP domain-containing protein [Rhodobacter sp. NTK016B]MBN8294239.1 CAP domain-containing protein [Rhodobacter sp. NTK016B]